MDYIGNKKWLMECKWLMHKIKGVKPWERYEKRIKTSGRGAEDK